MEGLFSWLAEDPIRTLTLVGGSGGLIYWLERLWSCARIKVRILREDTTPEDPRVQFEAQNLGMSPISLEPSVVLVGYTPKARRHVIHFAVDPGPGRSLPPHVPQSLMASAPPDPDALIGFLWYRKYTFSATRGRPRHVRLRHLNGPRLSALRFLVELCLFRIPWTRGFLLHRLNKAR